MGMRLARSARLLYPELNHRARLLLTGMALTAYDDDTNGPAGLYFGSTDHRAELCGPIDAEPRPDDTSAEARHARARRKTRKRVDASTTTELLAAGAIVMLRPPAPNRTARYGLNLDPLTGTEPGHGGPSFVGDPVDWRRYARSDARSPTASERTQLSGPTDAAHGSNGRSSTASRGVGEELGTRREEDPARLSSHQELADSAVHGDDDLDGPARRRAELLRTYGENGMRTLDTVRAERPDLTLDAAVVATLAMHNGRTPR